MRTRDKTSATAALFLLLVFTILCSAAIAAVATGSTHVDWQITLRVIAAKALPFWFSLSDVSRTDEVIVWMIRFPRVIVAACVGAGLAAAGTLMQGLFRNALAEPNIIGVGSGAVLGAVIVFLSGLALRSVLALPLAAFCGALLALAVVYVLATRAGRTPTSTLLLSGIALATLLTAFSSFLISLSIVNWQIAQEIVFWMMGGLDSRSWTHVWISAPFIALGLMISLYYARDLDLLIEGEESAAALGVEVETTKRVLLVAAALLTGSCVAVAGTIGFVGLIVPHIVRLFVGPRHNIVLPSSALAGAAFLVICDLLARIIHPPAEIRLGIITAVFGAPFFLFLLLRHYREAGAV
jgi:iron complex transport system permease protein